MQLTLFDPAEGLTSDEAIAAFMAEAFTSEDAGYIAHALGVVARAKGMTQIAKDTGLSREQLYRSFSGAGNPTLKTTIAVMKALGIELTAQGRGMPQQAFIERLPKTSEHKEMTAKSKPSKMKAA
jgi:probable addiction module antidote protein